MMRDHEAFPTDDDGPTVDLARPREVWLWATRLRVSQDDLRAAVAMVGPRVEDVKQHLAIAELAYSRPPLMLSQRRDRSPTR